MQSKSQTSSKPFFKEDLQWQIKNSKLSFRGRTSEGDFTAEFFPKSWEGEDFFHGEKIICEALFQRNPTECAQTYQERFSAVTWQKIAAFPELGLKLEGVVRGKNKVCDLREPSRGPNIELSEARSHQPAWGAKGSHTPKSYWTNLLVIHAYTNTKGIHSYDWYLSELLSCISVRTCSYKSVRMSPLSYFCENLDLIVGKNSILMDSQQIEYTFSKSSNVGGVLPALKAEQRMAGVETLLWVLNIWID